MDKGMLEQLWRLTVVFNRMGLKPVICGGLGIYLLFQNQTQDIRVTHDIDLMITGSQAGDQARREMIAAAITGELEYLDCEEGKHFRFAREPAQRLDILAPPMEGVPVEGGRVKLVRRKLHGRLTPEACFIEEDLRTIPLTPLTPGTPRADVPVVNVPSPVNMLILKLLAFDDRDCEARRDEERAQAHAYDTYLIVALARQDDYLEGRRFLRRHETSEIVEKARVIVASKFSSPEQAGWRHVLRSAAFAPNRSMDERRRQLDEATRRLLRWFETSRSGPAPR